MFTTFSSVTAKQLIRYHKWLKSCLGVTSTKPVRAPSHIFFNSHLYLCNLRRHAWIRPFVLLFCICATVSFPQQVSMCWNTAQSTPVQHVPLVLHPLSLMSPVVSLAVCPAESVTTVRIHGNVNSISMSNLNFIWLIYIFFFFQKWIAKYRILVCKLRSVYLKTRTYTSSFVCMTFLRQRSKSKEAMHLHLRHSLWAFGRSPLHWHNQRWLSRSLGTQRLFTRAVYQTKWSVHGNTIESFHVGFVSFMVSIKYNLSGTASSDTDCGVCGNNTYSDGTFTSCRSHTR